jgi:hypothetical protein
MDSYRLSTGPWPEDRPGPLGSVRVSGSEVGGPDPNKRVQGQLVLTPDLRVGPGPGLDRPYLKGTRSPSKVITNIVEND